jgi:hypothetical protein
MPLRPGAEALLASRYRESCPAHPFTVKLLSRAPDIMIIEDFLTPAADAQFLINVAYQLPSFSILTAEPPTLPTPE